VQPASVHFAANKRLSPEDIKDLVPAGMKTLLMGGHEDVYEFPADEDKRGKTTLEEYLALLYNASACVGCESNAPIFCSQLGIPSVCVWRKGMRREWFDEFAAKVPTLRVVEQEREVT
jgi:hypothetical protein